MTQNRIIGKTFFPTFDTQPYSLITKPIGSICNLNCTYCYYLEKKNLFEEGNNFKMQDELLEEYIKQYIHSQPVSTVTFTWQGGEPSLMGIDFYKRAIQLQKKYANGKQIENTFQTNGTLINEEWCHFFVENQFLVGISIDGPKELHDKFRQTKNKEDSYQKVLRTIELFNRYKVEFNTLVTVNSYNVDYPLEIYRFLKSIGSHFIQFIPIVERVSDVDQNNGLVLVPNSYDQQARVTPWSVDPIKYGKFLSTIFDEWVCNDVGQYFIQLFDTTLANWIGETPGLCMFAPTCGRAGAIEHNGDVYSCDHFVFPEYKLGNIKQTTLTELMNSTTQQAFGLNKYTQLPQTCHECNFLNKCYGECPKKRFTYTKDGEYGLNYLCEGYKLFFSHVEPYMDFMANELNNKRSPMNVMYNVKIV